MRVLKFSCSIFPDQRLFILFLRTALAIFQAQSSSTQQYKTVSSYPTFMDGRTTPEKELFEAVKNDEPDEVRNLLRRRADIATKNKDGDTVLHLAASKGQEDVIQVLVRADEWKEIVNIKDAFGGTALHNCAMSGHTRTIELLLKNNADATATDQDGWTPLHYAAAEGYIAAVKCLAKHMKKQKMDCNQKTNTSGVTALHMAANRGFARIVDELMTNGASTTTTAWDGGTVLYWALEGAIIDENGLGGESEAGHEVHDDNLNDEVVKFDDDDSNNDGGAYRRIEHSIPAERAKDEPEKYDAVFEHILNGMKDKIKWSELLKVARREDRMEKLQYLMNKMYPRQAPKGLQRRLRRIWFAMSEARTQELMGMLWTEAGEERRRKGAQNNPESMGNWDSMEKWDILSLATSLGKVQTVYWLLRSRRWSKSDIDKAKRLPDDDRLNRRDELSMDGEIWNTPFVHDERSGRESYRWPTDDLNRSNLAKFRTTIMDFHRVDNQIVSIYYDCDTSNLMDEGNGAKRIVGRSMESLKNQKASGMVADEYSEESRCYRWIHLSINSVPWMKNLAMISYLDRDARREEWMATWQFLRRSWQELPENRDEEPYMRPNCLKEYLPQLKSKTGKESTTPKHDESMRLALALYIPYLTFGPFENTPHDKDLEDEHKGGILHRSRTLDQFYHCIQDDDRARDKNQVFTRFVRQKRRQKRESDKNRDRETEPTRSRKTEHTRSRKTEDTRNQKTEQTQNQENDETNFDILRVNQLWLWVIDDSTVITSTTHGLEQAEDPVFQGFLERLCQSQTMFNREATPSSVDSFVKLITSFYINAMDNLKVPLKVSSEQQKCKSSDDPRKTDLAHRRNSKTDAAKTSTASLTTVFADSVENNNDAEKNLRDAFRKAMRDKTSRSGDLHKSILMALKTLDDIKDIRDELNIINSVVEEQKTVWIQLFKQSRGSSTWDDASKEGYERYQWSNTDPDYVLKRVKDLLREAEETEHNITSVLELEMNQLNVSEAEEARRQGGTLMAFTIITAIFLPLSFLASLFALNVSTFPHSGNDVQYQPGWIFGIMFGATLAFVLFLLLTVFREVFFGTIANVFKKFQELSQKESQPTEENQDESKPAAEEIGHEKFKKRWQELSARWRKEKPGGESV